MSNQSSSLPNILFSWAPKIIYNCSYPIHIYMPIIKFLCLIQNKRNIFNLHYKHSDKSERNRSIWMHLTSFLKNIARNAEWQCLPCVSIRYFHLCKRLGWLKNYKCQFQQGERLVHESNYGVPISLFSSCTIKFMIINSSAP